MIMTLILLFLATVGSVAAVELIPNILPFAPNDEYGNYEPTITADGNSIYFARFSTVGDDRVCGDTTDLFVSHRITKSGRWPGTDDQWTEPERLPDTVNSCFTDQEPRISPDGRTLYWMSIRPGGYGDADIYVSYKQPNGEWSEAENLGSGVNSEYMDHCFMPNDIPGAGRSSHVMSIRPREPGAEPTADVYSSKFQAGIWQPVERVESELLDSIAYKCRLNTTLQDGMVLGILSIHNFGQYHKQKFIRYDLQTQEWVGPVVEAPYNMEGVDGACPMFTPDGNKMIWSAGYEYGPGEISQASGHGGSEYDLFWLDTQDIVDYYREQAGL